MMPKFILSNQKDKVIIYQDEQTVKREGLGRIAIVWFLIG